MLITIFTISSDLEKSISNIFLCHTITLDSGWEWYIHMLSGPHSGLPQCNPLPIDPIPSQKSKPILVGKITIQDVAIGVVYLPNSITMYYHFRSIHLELGSK